MAEMDQPPSPWENLDGDELLELARAAGIDVAELQADTIDFTTSITDSEGNTVTSLSDPVRVTEEASTFTESDVTVTHNGTVLSSESVKLLEGVIIDDFEDGDKTTKASNWNGWNGDTSRMTIQTTDVISGTYSAKLTANNQQTIVETDRDSPTTQDMRGSFMATSQTESSDDFFQFTPFNANGYTIGNLNFNGDGTIDWQGSSVGTWSINTVYDIRLDFDFPNDQVEIFINGTSKGTYGNWFEPSSAWQTYEVDLLTLTSTNSWEVVFDNCQNGQSTTNGDTLVEWDSAVPDDIKAYDLATFQATEDGETVTVDVEDGDGNVLFTDIGPNFDISMIDTSKNVKLRANLSRSDTANNPTLDYLARRFTR